MKAILCALLALATLCACSGKDSKERDYSENRQRMETRAKTYLAQARQQLAAGRPDEARKTIERMRKACYLAIDGRTQGIVLMDSVDLYQARQDLVRIDSLLRLGQVSQASFDDACRKVQFYERKAQYDLKQ